MESINTLITSVSTLKKFWCSTEYNDIKKYELCCQWLINALQTRQISANELLDLFLVRAQPGLVNMPAKIALIQAVKNQIETDAKAKKRPDACMEHPLLLYRMINFELFQDVMLADYNLAMSCYGLLFATYESNMNNLSPPTLDAPSQRHADFILPVQEQLSKFVHQSHNRVQLWDAYIEQALQAQCQLMLSLRQHNFCYFAQFAAIELQFYEQLETPEILMRIKAQPPHVRAIMLEAALLNLMDESTKYQELLHYVTAIEHTDLREELADIRHAMEAMRKHNISLTEYGDVLQQLSQKLLMSARKSGSLHPRELLGLLCSTIRFNPMVLEPHVYEITVIVMTMPKPTADDDAEGVLQLYSEYLVLLLDMCRRMSHTERFVKQLLKSLREWLSSNELQMIADARDSKRARLDMDETTNPNPYEAYMRLNLDNNQKPDRLDAPIDGDRLLQLWPSHSAGVAFSRLISQLMSKPSMVIWKMLLHTFSDLLVECSESNILPANQNVAIELHAALLGQYLAGTRLAEQVHLYHAEVEQLKTHTRLVMQQLGDYLLDREHVRGTMNAYLECVERMLGFELHLTFYWPDGLTKTAAEDPPNFVPSSQWELIRQRVHNFGKRKCRQKLKRLELQQAEIRWLLMPPVAEQQPSCPDNLVELVPAEQLVYRLSRQQKDQRLQTCRSFEAKLQLATADAECLELLTHQLLQSYFNGLTDIGKDSVLLQLCQLDSARLVDALQASYAVTVSETETETLIGQLTQLPLCQVGRSIKTRLWLLVLGLSVFVGRAQLPELANRLIELLIDMLHFGQPLAIFSYFPDLKVLLTLVHIDQEEQSCCWRFYRTIFTRCLRHLNSSTEKFLGSCELHFREQLKASSDFTLSAEQCRLLLLAIEALSSVASAQRRRMQRHLQPLLEIYGEFISNKFKSKGKKLPVDVLEFVQQTIGGYPVYLNSYITRAGKLLEKQQKMDAENAKDEHNVKANKADSETTTVDENLRRICKIYIGHSLDYRNPHAIRLMNVALTHRKQLHLDQDEIEYVLNRYWCQLNADIDSKQQEDVDTDNSSMEAAVKLIIGYKTNEDFLLLLHRFSSQLSGMQYEEADAAVIQNILVLLTLFSKCSLSSIKAAILKEQFQLISEHLRLRLPNITDAGRYKQLMQLLQAQHGLISNRSIICTSEIVDTMFTSMLDVNINSLITNGAEWSQFVQLHAAISGNLLTLVRLHLVKMQDRATQLKRLCQDLLEAVICYRSDRKQAQCLTDEELNGLADLSIKLVTLFSAISGGNQALAIKRVAPLLLIFIINLMVTADKPTTLFEKVRTPVDRICHQLIGMCDHRAGHFILRATSDAGRGMYQNLVKEHAKNDKFRGKV